MCTLLNKSKVSSNKQFQTVFSTEPERVLKDQVHLGNDIQLIDYKPRKETAKGMCASGTVHLNSAMSLIAFDEESMV